MKTLAPSTKLALRLGFKTKAYQQFIAEEALERRNEERREAYLTHPREVVLREYPETRPIYEVADTALRFYGDVLIATPTSLNTNRRNQLRAQAISLDAFAFLEANNAIPSYSREGRHEEASVIRAEELRTLRHELNLSFEENARVNPTLRHDAHARYAQFSRLFFMDEKEAARQFPELSPLITVKKQARRYFSQWIVEDKIDKAVKDCLNRALKDLARHIPLPNAEELKAEALALRSSWIGTQSSIPNSQLPDENSKKSSKKDYQYQPFSMMKSLIGKNGIASGWWPYNPDLLEHTDRINGIDNEVLKEQWVTSFRGEVMIIVHMGHFVDSTAF
ncbi:MAG: hypothetical protein H0T84_02945 [Tatlockia sp.]|nr:hypothetical protein [Tatlockia sp.]